jgi:N-acetylneuraminic acid mutarotase
MKKFIHIIFTVLPILSCQGAATGKEKPIAVEKGQWSSGAPMQTERTEVSSVVFNGKIFVIGGFQKDEGTTGTVEFFDPQTGQWHFSKPLPTARGGLAASVLAGKIHVFGGERPTATFGEHEIYDPAADTWISGPPLPTPRHGLAAVTFRNKIYVLSGGPKPGGSHSNIIEIFSVK